MKNPEPQIIFEDTELLVLDKPAGLTVHGGVKTGHTLTDFLSTHLPHSLLADQNYGLLHRLDRDTSGLILVAKTPESFAYYRSLFKRREIHKEYLVLLCGRLEPATGSIQLPLGRSSHRRTQFAVVHNGRPSETNYEVIEHLAKFTYLKAFPATGRTHQIRVHFASLGFPVAGDRTYGSSESGLSRQFLHAHRLNFVNMEGKSVSFVSELPTDLKNYLHGVS